MLDDLCCMFCLAPEAAHLMFDRRGKPYMRCIACGTRAFLPSPQALHGLAVVAPYAAQIAARMRDDASYGSMKVEQIAAFMQALRTRMAPAATAAERPHPAQQASTHKERTVA